MSLTNEQRYRPYAEWTEEEIKKIKENVANSPWHTNFHIEPPYGLLNDLMDSLFQGEVAALLSIFPIWCSPWSQILGPNRVYRPGAFRRNRYDINTQHPFR